jgi:laminin alpha 3/5
MEDRIICPCKKYVTGRKCDKCKDGFTDLDEKKDDGCSACQCSRDGTLNELDLCDQISGQCQCKLFVDSIGCDECKSGYYSLKRDDVFGCESCDCQPGSSIDNYCDSETGQCTCLPNIVGLKCDQPAQGFYVPDLHQLKFEIEDGEAKGKNVRYGFNENLFPKYSWKGYVHLNKNMGEVSQNVSIKKAGTYKLIIRYMNNNLDVTNVHIRVTDPNYGDIQRANLYLKPTVEPSFETVTSDQINHLILELEPAEYVFRFENRHENIFIVSSNLIIIFIFCSFLSLFLLSFSKGLFCSSPV